MSRLSSTIFSQENQISCEKQFRLINCRAHIPVHSIAGRALDQMRRIVFHSAECMCSYYDLALVRSHFSFLQFLWLFILQLQQHRSNRDLIIHFQFCFCFRIPSNLYSEMHFSFPNFPILETQPQYDFVRSEAFWMKRVGHQSLDK